MLNDKQRKIIRRILNEKILEDLALKEHYTSKDAKALDEEIEALEKAIEVISSTI